jgi:two-component system sensor histidine kinase CiaH
MTVIKKKLAFITIVYWFLLLYIIAALIWWFVSLGKTKPVDDNFAIN